MGRRIFLTAVLVACGGLPVTAGAERLPEIAIIIDDMGDRKRLGWEALQLPGPVAYAFLPDTPHGAPMAEAAWRANKEVLLHLPMDPVEARAHPTSISAGDDQATVSERLRTALASVPKAVGVNNHQGSRVTQSRAHMDWLMGELQRLHPLYFVDSRTAGGSVAFQSARAHGIPAAKRNIFLDTDPDGAAVAEQFFRLTKRAKRYGSALAIGHPYPSTLRVLNRELRQLPAHGVKLVSPSALIRRQLGAGPEPAGKRVRLTPSARLGTTATLPQPRTAR